MASGVLVNGTACGAWATIGRYCRLPDGHGAGHQSKLTLCWELVTLDGAVVGNCYLQLAHHGLCAALRYG